MLISGHPPFLAENYEDLREKITKKDMPPPRVRGCALFAFICLLYVRFVNCYAAF